MSNHGLRRMFSLLLAVMMVCTLLPTAVIAQEVTQQPVVTDEQQNVLDVEGENKEEAPNVEGDKQNVLDVEGDEQDGGVITHNNENGTQPQPNPNSNAQKSGNRAPGSNKSSGITVSVSCINALFLDGSGQHTVKEISRLVYVTQDEIGSKNASGFARARFVGSNDAGWTLVIDLEIGNYKGSIPTNARITNKDMSTATGSKTFGVTAGKNVSTHITIMGASDLPDPAPSLPKTDAIAELTNLVTLSCDKKGHTQQYSVSALPEACTASNVRKDSDSGKYVCTLTIDGTQFLNRYNSNYTPKHTITGDTSKTLTLTYDTGTKKWSAPNSAVSFTINCNEDQPKAPDAPKGEEVVALQPQVLVRCDTNSSGHTGRQWTLEAGTFEVGTVTDEGGVYTCTVTVTAETYVDKFNSDATAGGIPHSLKSAADDTKDFVLKYNADTDAWVVGGNPAVTFEVKCLDKPYDRIVKELLGKVTVECEPAYSYHESKSYDLIDGSFVRGDLKYDAANGYSCDITVNPGRYVAKYSEDVATDHTLCTGEGDKTVTLTYDETSATWSANSHAPLVFKVTCKPDKPTDEYVLNLLKGIIKIECITNPASHPVSDAYDLIPGSYTIGAVSYDGRESAYTCLVVISPEKYVAKYNETYPGHKIVPAYDKTLTHILKYENDSWVIYRENWSVITYKVTCETVVPTPPEMPGKETVERLLESAVLIHCKNEDADHGDVSFTLADGAYVLGEAVEENEGVYTYTVTVKPAKYVEAYSKLPEINKEHKLSPADQGDQTITLKYDELDGWYVVEGAAPVTYTVICENEPQKPKQPTKEDVINLGPTVEVRCTTGHGDATYQMRSDNFTPGTIEVGTMTGDDEKGYTCTVTVTADKYVEAYNHNEKAKGADHTLADKAEKTFELKYKDGKWTGPTNPAVTFKVECKTEPETTYTVTYTDGVVDEEVFADDVHSGLKAGAATPAFKNGTPTRKNYIFGGWTPEVAKTVTADVTYTATWKPDFNNNGKDDDTEERYTVTYKDGANGKVFDTVSYSDLLSGVDTPEFSGKLTRKGYTFAGWSPKVSKTVTKTVTYTATWKATSSTGKDKVPKTGDSGMVLILGSVMLFSFCGATAVYVFDRKRKQG